MPYKIIRKRKYNGKNAPLFYLHKVRHKSVAGKYLQEKNTLGVIGRILITIQIESLIRLSV